MFRIVTLYFYLEEVPLSSMLTIENSVKQIAPNPTRTRAGMKESACTVASSNTKAARNKQVNAVNTGIIGMRLASLNSRLHIFANRITLLEIL